MIPCSYTGLQFSALSVVGTESAETAGLRSQVHVSSVVSEEARTVEYDVNMF